MLAVLLFLGFLVLPAFVGGSNGPVLTILHTNDLHGRFQASDAAIGHDFISSVFDRLKAERNGAVLLLDAGDTVRGIYYVGQSRGESAIDIMNAAGYDAMTVGNHDFDYGWERLKDLAVMSDFPFLLSDTISDKAPGFAPYAIYERGNLKVGVFGLTTPETVFRSSGGFDKDFGDAGSLISYAQETTNELRAAGADIVICLAHLGTYATAYGSSFDVRDKVTGIDLIIDGHSHGSLSAIKQVDGKAAVVTADAYGSTLGLVEIYKDGAAYKISAESLFKEDFGDVKPNAKVAETIDIWAEAVRVDGTSVVAQIPFEIAVIRAEENTRETVMGKIAADAFIAASDADIAITHGGGTRAQVLSAGNVTKAQLVGIFPSGNYLKMARVSGSVILEALEHGVALYPEPSSAFPHVSGLTFTFDPLKPPGSRVSDVMVGDAPLDRCKRYILVANDFIATGGEGFDMLVEPFRKPLPLEGNGIFALEDALIWYFENYHSSFSKEFDVRITVSSG